MSTNQERPLFLGYTRVSTEEQAESRNGLEAQLSVIQAEANRRDWDVEYYSDPAVSGKVIGPQLQAALQLLASGQASGLVVAKLDRLSRSIINASRIITAANEQGWSLVVLDFGVDLTTAAGRMVAMNLVTFAQYERELIGERTRAALAAKKARNERIGRPRLAKPAVVRRIVRARQDGATFGAIAQELGAEGVLSPTGLTAWQPSTVRRIYQAATAAVSEVA